MSIKSTSLFVFLFLSYFAKSQNAYISLKTEYDRLRKEEKVDSALLLAKQMNVWALQNETDTSLRYAVSCWNIGNCYSSMEKFDSSVYYYKFSIELLKFQNRDSHPTYASCLRSLGNLYSDMGDYRSAEPFLTQALEIIKKSLGEEHTTYASCLRSLGDLYSDMGDYKTAEPYYKQDLEIIKKALGEEHATYVSCLRSLGDLYSDMGDYRTAEPYYKQALAIKKKSLGEEHPDYATSLYNLGNLYYYMSDYKSAEQNLKQALAIIKKSLGEEHIDYATCLQSLGVLYSKMGDYKSAELFLTEALEIKKKSLGDEHLDYASCLNSLGNLYNQMGAYKTAEPILKQALAIRKKSLGEEHPDYATSLNNLGAWYHKMGDYNAAEPYYKKALEINKKVMGENHPVFAHCLNNLGFLYSNIGDYEAADWYFKQALENRKKFLGEEHPDYALSLKKLGDLYEIKKDYKTAEMYYEQALHVKLGNLNTNFSWISAKEKAAYWQLERDFYENVNSFTVLAIDSASSSTELSFNANLISKSLLLESSRELDQAISKSSDKEIKVQFTEMKQLRSLYSKLQSEGSMNKKVMSRYKTQADSLDKILVNKLGEYAASKRKFEITWQDVQSNLASTEAAIEFARYYDDKDSVYKYMALVVRLEYEYPQLVKLGEEAKIKIAAENKDFSTLYELVWKDMDTLLSGVQTVYYSPAGELNNVSFPALCFQAGDSVLSILAQNRGAVVSNNKEKKQSCNAVLLDKYTLHQLTTTRYLADGTLNKSKPMNLSLALYGGVNYDDIPSKGDTIVKEISNEDYAFELNLSKEHSRGVQKKKGKRSSSSFGKKMEYLPGTKEEVANIQDVLTNTNWHVQTKSDKSAGEYEFKKDIEANAPGVLHIATHGFAFPDEVKKETLLLEMNQASNYKVSEDPMVRCGLMLSGSNISWTGNGQEMIGQTGDDGILTAAEVANLDLANTKLVVLSACETGLGKIEGSEGTFGLKRGFKLAGVEQIIVSLWSVPDKETMELMTLFYTNLTKTLNPIISFEKAQKEMRNKYPTEPEKWAGFVLVR